MSYAGAARIVAMGIFVALVTACGGGGGSDGGGSGGGLTPRPDVALPDIASATQKALTPDNSKQALILALNTISFVEAGNIPVPPAVDFFADTFSDASSLATSSRKSRVSRPALRTVDVSDDVCISGSAIVEAGESLIGRMVQRYRSCDTGDGVLDGDVELDIRAYVYSDTVTDVTFTFRGLRVTSGGDDSVFDGTVVMTTNYPGAGFVAADLDIRDLIARKGMRVRDYRADFDIDYASNYNGNYVYFVRQLRGRIYDDSGEYFDLGLTPEHAPWPMLIGENSRLMLSPSDMAAPYQVQMALDTTGDNVADHWLFVDLGDLGVNNTNSSSPEFQLETDSVSIDRFQRWKALLTNVSDADQQFVTLNWELVEKPEGSSPEFFAVEDGIEFMSGAPGNYRIRVSATDGLYSSEQMLDIRVMYDVPQISASIPSSIDAGETVSFQVDVLNPEQGTIAVTPLAVPGLQYDGTTATFMSELPNFGMEQQVNIGFIVSNEDRQHVVTYPVTIRAPHDAVGPMMLSSDEYWWSSGRRLGQFTEDASLELVEQRYEIIHLFELDPQGKRYRESFDVRSALQLSPQTYIQSQILGVFDVDDDGVDEILLTVLVDQITHLVAFDTRKRKIVRKREIAGMPYNLVSGNIAPADLDGDGTVELSAIIGGQVSIFDSNLNVLWQSAEANIGGTLLAANFDSDAALELVTSSGYVLDGVSRTWQERRGFFTMGTQFFAWDTDDDGISEFFMADSMASRTLRQMTASGYVSRDIGAYVHSNVIVQNMDGDAADEIVFITKHDATNAQEPYPWISVEGAVALVYLDVSEGSFSVVLQRELQRGDDFKYALYNVDVDGVGSTEYLGLLGISSDSIAPSSFIYHGDTDTQQLFSDAGMRLAGSLLGGAAISTSGEQLVFCGRLTPDLGVTFTKDIFTFDTENSSIDFNLTALIDGMSSTLEYYVECYPSKLAGSNADYVVSVGNSASSAYDGNTIEVKIQNAQTGDAVFSKRDSFETLVSVSAIGDFDGNGSSDIIVGGDGMFSAYDIGSGEKLASGNLLFDSILDMKVADVIAGNGRDEVIVLTPVQLQVLAYDGSGSFTLVAQRSEPESFNRWERKPLQIFDATGDGIKDIVRAVRTYTNSPQFQVDILDGNLQWLAGWTQPGMLHDMLPHSENSGAYLLASLESESWDGPQNIVWRDPMRGVMFGRSPGFSGMENAKLNFVNDVHASKLRAVLTSGQKVYITQ